MDQFIHDAGNVQTILGFSNAYQSMMDQLNIFAIRTPSVDKGISLIAEDNNGRATKMKLMENRFTINFPGIYILKISRGEADRFIRIIKL